MEGSACLIPATGGLLYRETGLLAWPGQAPLRAERSYRWRAEGDGQVVVCFADGRHFHSFDADAATPLAQHECDPDLYRVAYDFRRFPEWSAEWTVTGPRKNYTMRTAYCGPTP